MKRKFLICCVMAVVSFNCMSTVALASTGSVRVEKETLNIDPRVDKIGYQYKVIDNVLYRRLYNFTANKPVGDWEVAP